MTTPKSEAGVLGLKLLMVFEWWASLVKIEALIWVSFWMALKFQPFSWKIGSNPRHQSKNIEMKHKVILSLCMNYMVHVFSIMRRIKNHPSNSTSCSDNAIRLLVLEACQLYQGLHQVMMSSFCNLRLRFEGLFERGIFWRALKASILNTGGHGLGWVSWRKKEVTLSTEAPTSLDGIG